MRWPLQLLPHYDLTASATMADGHWGCVAHHNCAEIITSRRSTT